MKNSKNLVHLKVNDKYPGLIMLDKLIVEERYAFILHQFFRALSEITTNGGIIEIIYVEYCPETAIPNLHLYFSPEVAHFDIEKLFDRVQQLLLKAAPDSLF